MGHPVQPPCRSRVTQSRLHRTLSRRGLNISREGDSTTSLSSLFQGSVPHIHAHPGRWPALTPSCQGCPRTGAGRHGRSPGEQARQPRRGGETWCRQAVDVLPELGDGAGEVGGVAQGVVGEAVVGVPGVPTALPRQVLCRHKDIRVSINVTSLKGSSEKRNLGSFELKCICLFIFLKRIGDSSGWAGTSQPKV